MTFLVFLNFLRNLSSVKVSSFEIQNNLIFTKEASDSQLGNQVIVFVKNIDRPRSNEDDIVDGFLGVINAS
jgi:hypothetical protein